MHSKLGVINTLFRVANTPQWAEYTGITPTLSGVIIALLFGMLVALFYSVDMISLCICTLPIKCRWLTWEEKTGESKPCSSCKYVRQFPQKLRFAIYIKCYKTPLSLNLYNFTTVKAINFLFSTVHSTAFLYDKIHFGVLH